MFNFTTQFEDKKSSNIGSTSIKVAKNQS